MFAVGKTKYHEYKEQKNSPAIVNQCCSKCYTYVIFSIHVLSI